MAVTVQASQGPYLFGKGGQSGRWVIVGTDGTQLITNAANFGASAQGAAIDTFVTAHGLLSIQELEESS